MKTIVGSLFLLVLTLAAVGGLFWYKQHQIEQEKQKPAPPEVPESVSILRVTEVEYQESTNTIGTIVPPRWVSLRNETSGRITKLQMTPGQVVEPGAVLIELDSSVENASLKSAHAKLKLAEALLSRSKRLANSVSEQELEQTKAEFVYAQAEVQRLEAVIEKRTMRAPFRARVGLFSVSVGQYLTEGFEITTLMGIEDHVFVDFTIPQKIANLIKLGQTVQIDVSGKNVDTEVIALDARSDRTTRSLMVRSKLKSPPAGLLPNDSVQVNVPFGPKVRGLAIPYSAVLRSPDGTQVYLVETDANGIDRAKLNSITVGKAFVQSIVVLQGLKLNDQIVADGAFKLRPGQAVRNTKNETPPLSNPGDSVTKDAL